MEKLNILRITRRSQIFIQKTKKTPSDSKYTFKDYKTNAYYIKKAALILLMVQFKLRKRKIKINKL